MPCFLFDCDAHIPSESMGCLSLYDACLNKTNARMFGILSILEINFIVIYRYMPLIQMQENNNKTFMMLHSACSCMLTSYQYTYDIFDNSCADPDFFRRRVLSDNYVWNYGKEVGCLRFIFSYFTTGIKGIRRIRSGPPTPSRFAQAVDIHSILLSFFLKMILF